MKLGILTFHCALNYGALLQAFALQRTINGCGAQTEIIDYHCDNIEQAYHLKKLNECNSLKDFIKYMLCRKYELKRRERFELFRKNYLKLSKTSFDAVSIQSISNMYDKFVVGSDQVWNYKAHNFDKNYFLNFCKCSVKKYSYAASFGISHLPEKYVNTYRDLLCDFQVCSVREQQGVEILRQLSIYNSRIDIDPTLLMDSTEWKKALHIKPDDSHFIFAYYFELTSSLKRFIEQISIKTGYPVLYLGSAVKSPFKCKSISLKEADPIDFVNAIENADYVVTNSFHGTAFSINFNKTFFVELLQSNSSVNSRLTNILDSTGLNSRQISSFSSIDDALKSKINWIPVNEYLEEARSTSLTYIKRMCIND